MIADNLDNLRPRGGRATNQRWATFVRKHAKGTLANQPQSIPKDIDGQNLLPVLNGQQQPHEAMYWSFNKQRAIRVGEWKLILNYPDIPVWLSNLEADPGEKTNLADAQSDRVRQLTEMIRAWERTVGLLGE